MIIDSSLISMASSNSLVQEYQKTEELTVKVSNVKPPAEEVPTADKVSISDKALQYLDNDLVKALERLEKHMERARNHPGKGYGKAMRHLTKDLNKAIDHLENHMEKVEDGEVNEIRGIKINSMESNKYGLSKDLMEALTGRKIRLHDIDDNVKEHHKGHDDDDHVKGKEEKQRWEVSYNMKETLYESEQMNFNSNGIVRTADGRVINFSLDLMMSRQYMEENEISFEASGTGKANILVDFAGPASALTDTRFGFGIEPEESGDSLSYLALGSGLLTLDLNNDGQIDSINELVGNATGNGFTELAAYDQDGNGWIDENDAVYARLKILSQESEGNDVLSGLKDSNIGAINLGSVDSPYALKNDQNVIVGQIEKSGIYLTEDGTVEQVQQLSKIV
jgi:hypothetical protein